MEDQARSRISWSLSLAVVVAAAVIVAWRNETENPTVSEVAIRAGWLAIVAVALTALLRRSTRAMKLLQSNWRSLLRRVSSVAFAGAFTAALWPHLIHNTFEASSSGLPYLWLTAVPVLALAHAA